MPDRMRIRSSGTGMLMSPQWPEKAANASPRLSGHAGRASSDAITMTRPAMPAAAPPNASAGSPFPAWTAPATAASSSPSTASA